ncbi:hypothetical protein P1J78_21555 [Psychromarinibacter sp. C21-152]|uniref:Uncharacterized protein n=1 Tax=Psychromarinibacter sediminicola TaxID=3033385 RepID=A0AAE3TAY5_9RHOB|nr:hypothetical protein [Psychromarinibacter sediminicola]MDF0603323.1 hypothetical protein [Psychromarinibacter sediminicola]
MTVVNDLQDYWTLVSAHRRRGDEQALDCLFLMADEASREGQLAALYVAANGPEETDVAGG